MRWYQFQKKKERLECRWASDWCPIDWRPSLLYDVSQQGRTKGVSLTFPNCPSTPSSSSPRWWAASWWWAFVFISIFTKCCWTHPKVPIVVVGSSIASWIRSYQLPATSFSFIKSYAAFPKFRMGIPQLAWKWDATLVISSEWGFHISYFFFYSASYVLWFRFSFSFWFWFRFGFWILVNSICIHGRAAKRLPHKAAGSLS